jgi:hypothetical protein
VTSTIKRKNIHDRIAAEAIYIYEQFMVKRANTYRAGFDNGYGMGFYHGLKHAAELCINPEKVLKKPPRREAKPDRCTSCGGAGKRQYQGSGEIERCRECRGTGKCKQRKGC